MSPEQEESSQPPASAGGCAVCGKQPAPYRAPDGSRECQNHRKIRQRRERGLKNPGPKPDPTKPRSRHGAARAGEGLRGGVKGRPPKDWSRVDRCEHGHELTPENTYTPPGSAQKICKICRRNSQLRYKGRADEISDEPVGVWNGDKTHCPQGHEYTESNTGRHPDGSRFCRRCRRDRYIRDHYQLTPEEFDDLLIAQDGRCAICSEELVEPHVDHDHSCCSEETSCGECVRGLLCSNCNNGLGRFQDDPTRLRAAAEYLEQAIR